LDILILFIINYYILFWDFAIGLLLFLTLIALILDIIIFTNGDFIKDNMNIINTNFFNTSIKIEDEIKKYDAVTYKDINDIILEQLIHYNKLHEKKDNLKSYNSYL